jgi:hypothetical protein
MPVEQPTPYNLKTARLLNLTIPSALLASADEVNEAAGISRLIYPEPPIIAIEIRINR